MELNCRVIEDLLPLYYDGHCRNGSVEATCYFDKDTPEMYYRVSGSK